MTETKPTVIHAATYDSVAAPRAHLNALEQLPAAWGLRAGRPRR